MQSFGRGSSAVLQEYLHRVRRRLQLTVASRGVGTTALAALLLTLVCVWILNLLAFSDGSVISGRMVLFGGVIGVLVYTLIRPLRGLGGKKTAEHLERSVPAFGGRMETYLDTSSNSARDGGQVNPLADLLAEDTLRVAESAPAEFVVDSKKIFSYTAAALAGILTLVWLGSSGPGYWGYGTSRLWGGWMKPKVSPLYQIIVEPGKTTIRQGADLQIKATMVGFETPTAQLFAMFKSGTAWEEAPMRRELDGPGFEFLFTGVREPLRYYISAGGIRSDEFAVDVVEMPNVEKLKLTYEFPSWTGMRQQVEDPGGDIRAVAGTEVIVEATLDKPMNDGVLRVNGETSVPMKSDGLTATGRIKIAKNGEYFVGAMYSGETVRLSHDYFITVVPDEKPEVKLNRPGRDWRATPIEEVVVEFTATDDFGVNSLDLHYSVNGGKEATVPLAKGGKEVTGRKTLFLEELDSGMESGGKAKLVPGDIISYYASTKDAKTSARTDIYFIEVQPFEREFFQQQGQGGGGGEMDQQNEISQRQKEIIAATWNLIQESAGGDQRAKAEVGENAKMLSQIQLTLRDQAKTLAERAKARQLAGTDQSFKSFVENLEKAAEYMQPAADELASVKLQEAISPEQKALQHLMRAESIFRQINITMSQGGGGGGGGAGRDLAEMFELEMDLEKNQYETGGGASPQQLEREIDDAMEKLRELARRQEKLAEQARREQEMSFEQRWQQEMLRREAEELKRQLEQLQRRQQSARNQQSQQGQQGQQGQQSGQQNSQSGSQGGQSGQRSNLNQVIERLEQATRDMQSQSQSGGQSQEQREANARRAQQRLQEALNQLDRDRQRQAGSAVADIAQRAAELAEQQREVGQKMREVLKNALEQQARQQASPGRRQALSSGLTRSEERALAEQKMRMQEELESLERKMQDTSRRMNATQPDAARKLREAIGDVQQTELPTRLRVGAEYIRRGLAYYTAQSEETVTRALNHLEEQTKEAERLAQAGGGERQEGLERTLAQLESLRDKLEQAASGRDRRPGQQPGQGEQQGQQGQGQQPGENPQGQGQQQGQQQDQQGQGQQAGQGREGDPNQRGQQGQGQAQGQQGQGQQPGEGQGQGQGQQQGSQGSGGQQPGQQPGSSGSRGGAWGGGPEGGDFWNRGAPNFGGRERAGAPGVWDPETRRRMEEAIRQGARDIPRVTRELRASGMSAADLEEIRKFAGGLSDSQFRNNPEMLEREYRQLVSLLQQLELQVRRKVEVEQGGDIRAVISEPVPEQYRQAVAEYFRRLSEQR